ncbi:putative mitochondrial hypothetical protein [Leptomonas pyrrhocoris]|uniref:Uncharacterized protein n=1 Tax=Leptomonas pyrrhocoris TaxID=157538 RepID=A0A0N1J451_LEPPY|nr:putative mitochondrial hypothetical protein [Leptomonas pyrrhocoris]KPA73171.1 putative mitochondrial hypothetical protein [Leptomonas pyrrhocoris]|eukprot:XP_015651610.1 putative mitochondrial hypothetical protein [Leptomonas pyrrhocoris]
MRRFGAFGSLSASRCGAAAAASGPALRSHLHQGPSTAPSSTAEPAVASSSSPATSPTPPLTEDYRALLLDLLLYRQETVGPLLTALRREREELEAKMTQLEAHIRELRQVRDELRLLSEKEIGRENRQLHGAIMKAVAPPRAGDEAPLSSSRQASPDEIVL